MARVTFYDINNHEVPQWVYVDSGADLTLLPKSLGDLLGFKLDEGEIKEVRGVGERSIPVILKKTKNKIYSLAMNRGPSNFSFPISIPSSLPTQTS